MKRTVTIVALVVGVFIGIMISVKLPQNIINTVRSADQEGLRRELQSQNGKLDEFSKIFRLVAKVCKPSVVSIHVEIDAEKLRAMKRRRQNPYRGPFHDPFEDLFRFFNRDTAPDTGKRPYRGVVPVQSLSKQTIGSGVIVRDGGIILTNNHVVKAVGDHNIKVRLSNGEEYPADIVGTDPKTDIGVLRIEADGLNVAVLGDSSKIEVGDWVVALGYPFALGHTVTTGIISAKERNVQLTRDGYYSFLQTDTAINPGNSGGALVNLKGEVIGINTAIYSRSGGYQGIGFAIPINQAKKIMTALIKHGKVVRGWLGVQIMSVTPAVAGRLNLKVEHGVLVRKIVRNGPADQAGARSGDVIVRYNDTPIKKVSALRNRVAATQVGTMAELEIVRDGRKRTLSIRIGELPEN